MSISTQCVSQMHCTEVCALGATGKWAQVYSSKTCHSCFTPGSHVLGDAVQTGARLPSECTVHVCGLLSAGVTVEFDRTLLTTREDILTLSVCLVKTGNTTIENSADVIACNRSLPNHLPAVDGADYSRSSIVQTITFAPEESRKCFVVGIIDDKVVEGSEAFEACVRTESFSVEIGSNDSVTVVIMDNDGERPGYLWIYI